VIGGSSTPSRRVRSSPPRISSAPARSPFPLSVLMEEKIVALAGVARLRTRSASSEEIIEDRLPRIRASPKRLQRITGNN